MQLEQNHDWMARDLLLVKENGNEKQHFLTSLTQKADVVLSSSICDLGN